MHLAAGGAPTAMKRRAVEQVKNIKKIPVFLNVISTSEDSKYAEFAIRF
jgi:hypothetical protein